MRQVKVKRAGGEVEEVSQYYHRYVVAMLIGPVLDVVLAIEPVLNEEARRDTDSEHTGHDELTAAHRLLDTLHRTWGSFIDAAVCDALYANGPWMTHLDRCGFGGFIVLKKDNHEPFKEALALWQGQSPCETCTDAATKEHIQFWDSDDIDTLATYNGKINQWIQYWNLGHVFRHTSNAIMAVLLLWTLAFNLLQLFIYRRLKRPRRPKDPTDTIRHIVEVMLRDVATLPDPIPWIALLDTS